MRNNSTTATSPRNLRSRPARTRSQARPLPHTAFLQPFGRGSPPSSSTLRSTRASNAAVPAVPPRTSRVARGRPVARSARNEPPVSLLSSNAPPSDATSRPRPVTVEDVRSALRALSSDLAEQEPCVICMCDKVGRSVLLPCLHLFCYECITRWIDINPSCPLCKTMSRSILYALHSETDFRQHLVQPGHRRSSAYHPTTSERHPPIMLRSMAHFLPFFMSSSDAWPDSSASTLSAEVRLAYDHCLSSISSSHASLRRRMVYVLNLQTELPRYAVVEEQNTSPNFFRANPAQTHRLVAFVLRDLCAFMPWLSNCPRLNQLFAKLPRLLQRHSMDAAEGELSAFVRALQALPEVEEELVRPRFWTAFTRELQIFAASAMHVPHFDLVSNLAEPRDAQNNFLVNSDFELRRSMTNWLCARLLGLHLSHQRQPHGFTDEFLSRAHTIPCNSLCCMRYNNAARLMRSLPRLGGGQEEALLALFDSAMLMDTREHARTHAISWPYDLLQEVRVRSLARDFRQLPESIDLTSQTRPSVERGIRVDSLLDTSSDEESNEAEREREEDEGNATTSTTAATEAVNSDERASERGRNEVAASERAVAGGSRAQQPRVPTALLSSSDSDDLDLSTSLISLSKSIKRSLSRLRGPPSAVSEESAQQSTSQSPRPPRFVSHQATTEESPMDVDEAAAAAASVSATTSASNSAPASGHSRTRHRSRSRRSRHCNRSRSTISLSSSDDDSNDVITLQESSDSSDSLSGCHCRHCRRHEQKAELLKNKLKLYRYRVKLLTIRMSAQRVTHCQSCGAHQRPSTSRPPVKRRFLNRPESPITLSDDDMLLTTSELPQPGPCTSADARDIPSTSFAPVPCSPPSEAGPAPQPSPPRDAEHESPLAVHFPSIFDLPALAATTDEVPARSPSNSAVEVPTHVTKEETVAHDSEEPPALS